MGHAGMLPPNNEESNEHDIENGMETRFGG